MKVRYKDTTEYKIMQFIGKSPNDVILREDLIPLDSERQISRTLRALVKKRKIVKIGYGIYARLSYSGLVGKPYLPKGFVSIAREALTRLGVKWDISEAERAYNAGQSQQIPANPATKVLERFRRKISYKGMELRFE